MYEFGSIVLVPFPFTDLTASKVRPALIISKKNTESTDVIVCFITSKPVPSASVSALLIQPTTTSGLKVVSFVRFDKIATVDCRIILGELGRIEPQALRKHRKKFVGVFGF